jgi:hypothetical protein
MTPVSLLHGSIERQRTELDWATEPAFQRPGLSGPKKISDGALSRGIDVRVGPWRRRIRPASFQVQLKVRGYGSAKQPPREPSIGLRVRSCDAPVATVSSTHTKPVMDPSCGGFISRN